MENSYFLRPPIEQDREWFLEAVAKIYDVKLTKPEKEEIERFSGAIPRLVKRLVKLVSESRDHKSVLSSPMADPKFRADFNIIKMFLREHPEVDWALPDLGSLDDGEIISGIRLNERLTRQEAALAKILIDSNGELVDRESMIKAVWPKNLYETSEHALDQMIHRLRKKIQSASPKCNLITFRGRGAKLELLG